jgi:hypothetical protein
LIETTAGPFLPPDSKLLKHAQTEREGEIQPHGMAYDLGREPVPHSGRERGSSSSQLLTPECPRKRGTARVPGTLRRFATFMCVHPRWAEEFVREEELRVVKSRADAPGMVPDELPSPDTKRWVVRRKAAVVAAVQAGRITLGEALSRYQLTEEEYRSWERAFEQHGMHGLRATGIPRYLMLRTKAG